MKRDIYNDLTKWKENKNRKPILLRGARQIGKTWIVREFGKSFDNFIEINFEEMEKIKPIFDEDLTPLKLIKNLSNYLDQKIIPGKTLLFFDEAQMCPRAITSLRYFYEKMPELHIIAAGSLLEFALEKISFPVGRVVSLFMYPLSFKEFLSALGKEDLRKELEMGNLSIASPIHDKLIRLIRDHTILGGLPEVVDHYLETSDIRECQTIQSSLIESYRQDFEKYGKGKKIAYMDIVFNAIPRLLGTKVKYRNIDHNIRSNELEAAICLLEKAGIIYRVFHSSSNGVPLASEKNHKKFKIIFFDSGLCLRILGLEINPMLLNPQVELINKGSLAEQLVGQELIKYSDIHTRDHNVFYWHREKNGSSAEVDFITSNGEHIIPIEVKSGKKGTQKSLNLFVKEKNHKKGIRLSSLQYEEYGHYISLPFYAISLCHNLKLH